MNFTKTFYEHIMLRYSCGKCHFTNLQRPSDITLADYWGWQKTDPDFNKDNKGCSLVFTNTAKGREIFDAVRDRLNVIHADLDNCLQPNLCAPTKLHPKRKHFENDYVKKGFVYAFSKKYSYGWQHNARKSYQGLKKSVKRLIKKLLRR